VQIPTGYTLQWTGQYEFQLRARERLTVLIPIVFFIIFVLLYMTFHSVSEATIVMLSVVYAMTGGVILQWLLGYNFSVTSRSMAWRCRPEWSWSSICTKRSTSGSRKAAN
jgi:Cu(I)/Ag(I) efflux system membrane protein CusA/SilA